MLPGRPRDCRGATREVILSLLYETLHDVPCWLDLINEPSGLANEKPDGVNIAKLARTDNVSCHLRTSAAKFSFATDPLLDEPVATHTNVRAGKGAASSDVGDLREQRIVPVAGTDRSLKLSGSGASGVARKRVPNSTLVGAECKRRCQASAVRDTAGLASTGTWRDGANDLWHQYQRAHQADMATALGALSDDDIGAALSRATRFIDGRDHMHDLGTHVVGAGKHAAQAPPGHAHALENTSGPGAQHRLHGCIVWHEQQQIQPERSLRQVPNRLLGRGRDVTRRVEDTAENAETTSI